MNTHESFWIYFTAKNKKGAAAILALLAVIGILLLLYFIQAGSFFGPATPGIMKKGPAKKPWTMEDLLVPADKIIKQPRKTQPSIDPGFKLNATVSYDKTPRGKARIEFDPSGEISGGWIADYSHDTKNYLYRAEFKGNIAAEKEYIDDDGFHDDSKLFIYAKGSYEKKMYSTATGTADSETGTSYLTGWLDKNKCLSAELTLTTDKTWSAVYDVEGCVE